MLSTARAAYLACRPQDDTAHIGAHRRETTKTWRNDILVQKEEHTLIFYSLCSLGFYGRLLGTRIDQIST